MGIPTKSTHQQYPNSRNEIFGIALEVILFSFKRFGLDFHIVCAHSYFATKLQLATFIFNLFYLPLQRLYHFTFQPQATLIASETMLAGFFCDFYV